MPRERLSCLAVIPDDVTDPLLWRLALDVVAAHQPDSRGDCRNLQCVGQRGVCAAARNARRAMSLARASRPAPDRPTPAVVRGRAPVPARQRGASFGWFTRPTSAPGRSAVPLAAA
ncbi:hypothetical protein ACIBMZ_08775 [Micromonospora sp. NPDC049900]|uniref:hypothetical protein n=1 Tax=Micromonospora sp. NPDC049900 TaxID=3364275 RepID=UPI00379ADFFF